MAGSALMNYNKHYKQIRKFHFLWQTIVVAVFLLIVSTDCYSEIQYEPAKELSEAKKYFDMIERQSELKSYFPHWHYYNAKVYYDTAKYQMDEERDHTLASFYAVLALVELKTLHTIAMTRKIEREKIIYDRDQYKEIAEKGSLQNRRKAVIAGSFFKRSNGKYTSVIPEFFLFAGNTKILSGNGIEILSKIGTVMTYNPSSRISIKGIIKDKEKMSEAVEKTKIIVQFLNAEKRIGNNRISSAAEVNDKLLLIDNYRLNFNRIEFIITGLR
jgi:hypothetical protein